MKLKSFVILLLLSFTSVSFAEEINSCNISVVTSLYDRLWVDEAHHVVPKLGVRHSFIHMNKRVNFDNWSRKSESIWLPVSETGGWKYYGWNIVEGGSKLDLFKGELKDADIEASVFLLQKDKKIQWLNIHDENGAGYNSNGNVVAYDLGAHDFRDSNEENEYAIVTKVEVRCDAAL